MRRLREEIERDQQCYVNKGPTHGNYRGVEELFIVEVRNYQTFEEPKDWMRMSKTCLFLIPEVEIEQMRLF